MNCTCSLYAKSMIHHAMNYGFYFLENRVTRVIKSLDELDKEIDILVVLSYPLPSNLFKNFLSYFMSLNKKVLFTYFIGCTPVNFSFKSFPKKTLIKCFNLNFKEYTIKLAQKAKIVFIGSKMFETFFSVSVEQIYNATYFKWSFFWPIFNRRVIIYDDFFILHSDEENLPYKEFFLSKIKFGNSYIDNKLYLEEKSEKEEIKYEVLKKFPQVIYKKPLALDIETDSLDFKNGKILTIQYAVSESEAYIIDLETFEDTDKIKSFLLGNNFITHNGTFDSQFLMNFFKLERPIRIIYDTLYAEYILNPYQEKYGLKFLTYFYTSKGGYEVLEAESGDEEELDIRFNISNIEKPILYKYGAYDVCITYIIYLRTNSLLKKNKDNLYNYYLVYNKFLNRIPQIQNYGIKLDLDYYISFSKNLIKYLLALEEKIYSKIGEKINLRSQKQLDRIFNELYSDMDFIRTEKSGLISFNKEALKLYESKYNLDLAIWLNEINKVNFLISHLSIKDMFDILKISEINESSIKYLDYLFEKDFILRYRKGLLTSYHNEFVYPNNVLYHTVTGRMSSSSSLRGKVNFLALPKYKDYRKIFISRFKDGYLLEVDYEAMEVYVLALTVGDGALYKALKNNLDIHSVFGHKVWKLLKGEDISYEEFYTKAKIERIEEYSYIRGLCKNVTFTAQYGGGPSAIANSVGVDYETAKKLLEEYYSIYPEIYRYIHKISNSKAYKVKSILGRELHLPYCQYNIRDKEQKFIRTLINFPIQSAASNLTTLAFMNMKLKKSLPLLAIHDSILFDINPETEAEDLERIKYYMEDYTSQIIKKRVSIDLKLKISPKMAEEKGFFSEDMKNAIREEVLK